MPHFPVNTDTGSLPQGAGEQRPCHRKKLLPTEASSTSEFAGVSATSVSPWINNLRGKGLFGLMVPETHSIKVEGRHSGDPGTEYAVMDACMV